MINVKGLKEKGFCILQINRTLSSFQQSKRTKIWTDYTLYFVLRKVMLKLFWEWSSSLGRAEIERAHLCKLQVLNISSNPIGMLEKEQGHPVWVLVNCSSKWYSGILCKTLKHTFFLFILFSSCWNNGKQTLLKY